MVGAWSVHGWVMSGESPVEETRAAGRGSAVTEAAPRVPDVLVAAAAVSINRQGAFRGSPVGATHAPRRCAGAQWLQIRRKTLSVKLRGNG